MFATSISEPRDTTIDGRMDTDNTTLPSQIATLVHEHFDGLPTRSKPTIHPDGSREWIPMSGIVLVKGQDTPDEKLTCVAVTTGAKCLPASLIPQCKGLVLHDCHAEILAIRAFNHWLLNECRGVLAGNSSHSPYIRHRQRTQQDGNHWPPLELHQDVKIYMYCTCAPCGDASMELCMATQEDPTPWELPDLAAASTQTPSSAQSQSTVNAKADDSMDGRAHFSLLGVVRRKPARMDAESTRSKSCSDKLALRQVSSLLSVETALLVAPTRNAYLEGIVLPAEEVSLVGCERAFGVGGRMGLLNGRRWPDSHDDDDDAEGKYGYCFHPFKILPLPAGQIEHLWPFRRAPPFTPSTTSTSCPSDTQPQPQITTKRTISASTSTKKPKPSPISALWTLAPTHHAPIADHNPKSLPKLRGAHTGLYETVINGVKQGNRAVGPGARGASGLSRARMWSLLREVLAAGCEGLRSGDEDGGGGLWRDVLAASTYQEFKDASRAGLSLGARQQAAADSREMLKGWLANSGDEGWGLDVLIHTKKQKR